MHFSNFLYISIDFLIMMMYISNMGESHLHFLKKGRSLSISNKSIACLRPFESLKYPLYY